MIKVGFIKVMAQAARRLKEIQQEDAAAIEDFLRDIYFDSIGEGAPTERFLKIFRKKFEAAGLKIIRMESATAKQKRIFMNRSRQLRAAAKTARK